LKNFSICLKNYDERKLFAFLLEFLRDKFLEILKI
jgi:hypothetical protein